MPEKWNGLTKYGVEWNIFQGDTSQILAKLDANLYNCVITSPPYFWLRDYAVQNQIGLEETVCDYVEAINNVMDKVLRVLKDDGVLFLNLGDTYYSGKGQSRGVDPKSSKRRFGLRAVDKSGGLGIGLKPKSAIGIPWRVAIEMCKRGWILRTPIIWNRQHSLPESVRDRPRRSYEYIFMFVKNRKYFFNHEALIEMGEQDLWTISARPKPNNGLQTAPFPDELVKRCIDIGCPVNGHVMDPFAGSGTTLRVAVQSKRAATGIDISPTFCNYIVQQLNAL